MNKKLILIMIVVFIYISFSRTSVYARNLNDASLEDIAVTLVIDNSGSMTTTDSKRLRETAANIFIDLLSSDDYVSVITFNTKEEVVLPIQKIQNNNKANFKNILSQNIQAKGDTDYVVALEEAKKQLDKVSNGNMRKVIVFLTDGEPDPDNTRKNDSDFMNSYMNSLWKVVDNLALNKYEVYSVGFSNDINTEVLKKISEKTKGTIKISDNSSELATNFFDILGDLKNRKELLNETFNLKDKNTLEFDLNEYTSQATMAFINIDGSPFDVGISCLDDESKKDVVSISKFDKYNLITINNEKENIKGKWKASFIGEGNIQVIGNEDFFIKSWIINPEVNSVHSLYEPLGISVSLTGEASDMISVEGMVTKNGIIDEKTIKLEFKDNIFTGVYNDVDQVGKYNIEIKLIHNGQIITTNTTSFIVRELPFISTDFKGGGTNYRLDENFIVTSSLNIDGNKLFESNELKVDNYNLLLNYGNSGSEIIPLLDNGVDSNCDVKINDGIWSNKVIFNKEDQGKASIIVNGTYKKELFILEKSLGEFNVYPSGKLLVRPLNNTMYTCINGRLKIPLEIENTSNFTETMLINIDEEVGKLVQDRIKIEPLKKLNTYIYIDLDRNIEKKVYDVKINIAAENNKTVIEPSEFNTEVQVLSETEYLLRYLKDNMIFIGLFLGSLSGVLLLAVLLGLVFYKLFVHKNIVIPGKLLYWKEADLESKDKKEFDFDKISKDKIVISFNEINKSAEYYIPNSDYSYDIELTAIRDKMRWKFIDGYRVLFHRKKFSELLLKTSKPGIFIYEGKVFTSKKIYRNDKFITGGYIFQYFINDMKKSTDKGRNVLKE